MYDLLLRDARIVDGTGNPWQAGDVAITGRKIAAVGRLGRDRAHRVIDVSRRVVSPGFIDIHGIPTTWYWRSTGRKQGLAGCDD